MIKVLVSRVHIPKDETSNYAVNSWLQSNFGTNANAVKSVSVAYDPSGVLVCCATYECEDEK